MIEEMCQARAVAAAGSMIRAPGVLVKRQTEPTFIDKLDKLIDHLIRYIREPVAEGGMAEVVVCLRETARILDFSKSSVERMLRLLIERLGIFEPTRETIRRGQDGTRSQTHGSTLFWFCPRYLRIGPAIAKFFTDIPASGTNLADSPSENHSGTEVISTVTEENSETPRNSQTRDFNSPSGFVPLSLKAKPGVEAVQDAPPEVLVALDALQTAISEAPGTSAGQGFIAAVRALAGSVRAIAKRQDIRDVADRAVHDAAMKRRIELEAEVELAGIRAWGWRDWIVRKAAFGLR